MKFELYGAYEFYLGDYIYYGKSCLSFVGVIVGITEDSVMAEGIELGCGLKQTNRVEITNLEGIRVIDDSEFMDYVKTEPAFKWCFQ